MNFTKFFKTLSIALLPLAAMAEEPASVFITAGQSNADGRELVEFLPDYLKGGYRHLNYANVTSECDGTFSEYKFGKRFAFCDVTNHFIEEALGKDFYAIKCAYGGTSVAPGATHAHLPIWYADRQWISENKAYRGNIDEGKSLTLALTDGFKECAEKTLSKLPNGYDVKAIMWHQGESDRRKAADYYENLKNMITFMREQIYAVTGDESDKTLPFILGTVPHDSKQYSAEVEKAHLKVAQDLPNVYALDLSDVPLRDDILHFDGPGTEYVGKLMFNKLVELNLVKGKKLDIKKPAAKTAPLAVAVESERKWDFSQPWHENDSPNLEGDEKWEVFKSLGHRYLSPMQKPQELTAGNATIETTKGLFFKCPTGNRIILNPNKFICLYNDNISMIIPGVKAGQTVAITTRSAKGERAFVSDSEAHLELVSGGTPSAGKVTNVWKVKDSVSEPVDLFFHTAGGGVYVYSIEVTLPNI